MSKSGIEIAFRVGPHQQDRIISPRGCIPTLPAGHHLNAQWMNLILVEDERDNTDKHEQGLCVHHHDYDAPPRVAD